MAAVPVTINGVICDLYGRTITGPVKIVGELMRSDLSVGGGPIIPPPGDGKPPIDPSLHPEHPIVIPEPPPVDPPVPPTEGKPPPADGGWGWWPPYGWGYFPGPGEAGPKS